MIGRSDLAACRTLLQNGSRSFALAARLLPREVAEAATGLYAFCRVADDLIDGSRSSAERDEALNTLRRRLDMIYRDTPGDRPEDRAFACLVRRCRIPRALPDALLEGFAWDAASRRYRTLAELEAYGVRVAGTVGMMLCLVMGERRPEQLARACDLGIAMQLTNIARDVGEDAAAGRLYLPLDWLARKGLDADRWLQAPRHDARTAAMVAALLRRADALYRCADPAITALPRRCRLGIRAARGIYADIGRQLARQGHDPFRRRAVVGVPRKLALLGAAAIPSRKHTAGRMRAAHPAAQPLLRAVERPPAERSPHSAWAQTVALFLRLDQRTRAMTGPGR